MWGPSKVLVHVLVERSTLQMHIIKMFVRCAVDLRLPHLDRTKFSQTRATVYDLQSLNSVAKALPCAGIISLNQMICEVKNKIKSISLERGCEILF